MADNELFGISEQLDDTISRQAAIKAADSIIERDTSGNNDVVKAMTAWKEYIKRMPSAQPGWIPCSERCPERYDNYLITTEDGMVVFGVYDPREKQWCRYDSIKSWWIYGIKVLAWQHLPTPYREGEQDG